MGHTNTISLINVNEEEKKEKQTKCKRNAEEQL